MFLVIDIGGTKTLIAAFDKRGKKVKSFKFPTSKNQDSFLADLLQNLKDFQKFPVQKIVIALPGKISGISFKLGNLSWENQKLSFFKPLKNLFEDTPIISPLAPASAAASPEVANSCPNLQLLSLATKNTPLMANS